MHVVGGALTRLVREDHSASEEIEKAWSVEPDAARDEHERVTKLTVTGAGVRPGDVIRTRLGRTLTIERTNGRGSVWANGRSVFLDPASRFELISEASPAA